MTSIEGTTRQKILLCATDLIRTKGYSATRVDDVCLAAGITKGAFFHYFKTKQAMAVAAAQFFLDSAEDLFGSAPFNLIEDPLDRILGYIEFRHEILEGELPEVTCLLGTMVQETYRQYPDIREACQRHIWSHCESLVPMIQQAIDRYRPTPKIDALDLALHTQAVLQGSFILAKASGSVEIAQASIAHLRHYIENLFRPLSRATRSA